MIPVIDRLIKSGEANARISVRDVDKSRFDRGSCDHPRYLE